MTSNLQNIEQYDYVKKSGNISKVSGLEKNVYNLGERLDSTKKIMQQTYNQAFEEHNKNFKEMREERLRFGTTVKRTTQMTEKVALKETKRLKRIRMSAEECIKANDTFIKESQSFIDDADKSIEIFGHLLRDLKSMGGTSRNHINSD